VRALILVLLPCAGWAQPTYLQGFCDHQTTLDTFIALGFQNPVTAGSLLVISTEYPDPSTVVDVTDTQGNKWIRALPEGFTGQSTRTQIWYVPSARAGPTTVTVKIDIPGARILYLHEYVGFQGPATVDTWSSAAGDSVTPDSGPITTHDPVELLYAHSNSGSINVAPTGFMPRQTCSSDMSADFVTSSAGTYQAVFTGGGGPWYAAIVAFTLARDTDGGAVMIDGGTPDGGAPDAGTTRVEHVSCGCASAPLLLLLPLIFLRWPAARTRRRYRARDSAE
jgi:hypothetical protein